MSSLFRNPNCVVEIAKNDPECAYINKMMEMPAEFVRSVFHVPENHLKCHGVVPSSKLPSEYSYCNFGFEPKYNGKCEEKMTVSDSQNSSNSNSTVRMEAEDQSQQENSEIIENVSKDLHLSEEEEGSMASKKRSVLDTLDKCLDFLPSLDKIYDYEKHYNTQVKKIDGKNDKENSEKKSCTGDTEPFEESNDIEKIEKAQVASFTHFADNYNGMKRYNVSEVQEGVSSMKKLKLNKDESVVSELSSSTTEDSKEKFQLFVKSGIDDIFSTRISYTWLQELNLLPQSLKDQKHVEEKLFLETQRSFPFNPSLKKDINELMQHSTSTESGYLNKLSTVENVAPSKKPQAPAKQFFTHSVNYSGINPSSKVAFVKGKVNSSTNVNNQLSVEGSTNNRQNDYSQPSEKKKREDNPIFCTSSSMDHETEESTVIKGLTSLSKMRYAIKKDFINRMKQLDIKQWLNDAKGLEEKAEKMKNKLEYPPMILSALKKYLYHNFSLDVRNDSRKCHEAYMDNAAFVGKICYNIRRAYREYLIKIGDKKSPQYMNILRVDVFAITLCLRIKSILQYRAFRSVSEHCTKLQKWLHDKKIIDLEDKRGATFDATNNLGLSPVSAISSSYSPQQKVVRYTSTPHNDNNTNHMCYSPTNSNLHRSQPAAGPSSSTASSTGSTQILTPEIKACIQKYCIFSSMINSAHRHWEKAEHNESKYMDQGVDYEARWNEIVFKVIEKSGGLEIRGIDESIPFVIKYLDGFIHFLNDFNENLFEKNTFSEPSSGFEIKSYKGSSVARGQS